MSLRLTDASIWEIIEAEVPDLRADMPGLALAIWQEGEAHYFCKGVASRGGPPITPATIFDLASVSKMFTALAVMLAADEHGATEMTLLRDILPEMRRTAPKVTLGHLLHHLSELPDYMGLFAAEGLGPEHRLGQSETLAILSRQPPAMPPGQRFSYSNTGYVLLSSVVERLSGLTLALFLKQHVFAPLGMARTAVVDQMPPQIADLAQSYTSADGPEVNPLWEMTGDGQIHSCLADLRLWQAEVLYPRHFPREIARLLTRGRTDGDAALDYGNGVAHEIIEGHETLGHDGGWAGFSSSLLAVPSADLSVAVLANRADIEAGQLARRCCASVMA